MTGGKDSMPPAISIIMPTFNSEEFIGDALESLSMQSFQDFELLVCDGGSTDGTLERIFSVMGAKARIASSSDCCIPDGLNQGFHSAKGDVVCWLNSDDVLVTRTALEGVMKRYNETRFDVAIADSVVLNKKGEVVKTLIAFGPMRGLPQSAGNVFTGSLFFSRKAWGEFGGFSCKYTCAFEYELTDWLYSRFVVEKMNAVVGGFRIHEEGVSSKFKDQLRDELCALRSNERKIGQLEYQLLRYARHFKDKSVFEVIRNKFYDPSGSLHWRVMYGDLRKG
ncbi:glycosyltransferase [Chlorobium sp. N1]|nr:glycosyltransferase [Chlorobium sp. N1]